MGLRSRERNPTRGCIDVVKRNDKWRVVVIASLALILAAGCTSTPATSAQVQSSPKAAVHSFNSGCAGTVVTDAEPPLWAQGGWSHTKGTPWPVPWAFGTNNDTVAYVFATQLVAGGSPRVNGTNNKVLWVAKDSPSGANVLVEGRPFNKSNPVVTIAGGPSFTDVPTAECWTFRLSWGPMSVSTAEDGTVHITGQHSSTINLQVLPAGTLPS